MYVKIITYHFTVRGSWFEYVMSVSLFFCFGWVMTRPPPVNPPV